MCAKSPELSDISSRISWEGQAADIYHWNGDNGAKSERDLYWNVGQTEPPETVGRERLTPLQKPKRETGIPYPYPQHRNCGISSLKSMFRYVVE